uniref:Uncharacterized protein n=1 Tax=Vibrio sp. F12 FF_152 TaxID=1652829 RepID=A0A0H3ZTU8_9VIBR|nr:hypothetical protein [Vibrio sp. F12 FF_152]
MCPSNNNQTVSNGLIATSDSTLELEGSSKNDNYLVRDILKNGWSSFGENSSPIWADYDAIEIMFCVEYEANDQSILEPFSMNDVQEVKTKILNIGLSMVIALREVLSVYMTVKIKVKLVC